MVNHQVALSEVATIIMGTSPKGETYNREEDGLPLLNGPTEFGASHPECTLFTTASKKQCEKGDLILCVRGSTTGRMNWADRVYSLGRGVCSIRGKSLSETKYIRYCLEFKLEELLKRAGGSTFPNLASDHISTFSIPYAKSRYKIAAILSAYDDLIENNNRRIEILEEMARMLYREWFVKFRYPGHESDRFYESELGLIPEGWDVKKIGEVIQTFGGGTPSTKKPEYWEGGTINWFAPKNLTAQNSMFITNSEKKITDLGLKKSSAKMFPAYSVMMTSRATIGVKSINTQPACTNQGFITCVPNERLSAYQIYFWIEENLAKIDNFASGATFKEIGRTNFRNLPIIIAAEKTRKRFAEAVTPMGEQIEILQQKNNNLRQTRDLLLPRLISGEIDVEKLDIKGINN